MHNCILKLFAFVSFMVYNYYEVNFLLGQVRKLETYVSTVT
jgi:hypothetical protein